MAELYQVDVSKRMAYLEKRAMSEHMKPHELVRQVLNVLADFQPSGDPTWALRQIKDYHLDFARALSLRYPKMEDEERHQIGKLLLFEAARRYLSYCSEEDLERYKVTIRLCEEIERMQMSIANLSRLFPQGALSDENVRFGYERSEAYDYLSRHATLDGHFEIATTLHENELQVHDVVSRIKAEWVRDHAEEDTQTQQTQLEGSQAEANQVPLMAAPDVSMAEPEESQLPLSQLESQLS